MIQIDRTQLFDGWADHYDPTAAAEDDFPFAGYERILDEVVGLADVGPAMRVLDLGVGTGNLAVRFLRRSCLVWGMDLSAKMVAQARARLPQVTLVRANLLDEWPISFQQRFDRVVSAYVLHEFDLDTRVKLLKRIATDRLSPSGRIVIADIAFPTTSARTEASQRWAASWDEVECYWAADEATAACHEAGLLATYRQLSACGGVFVFTIAEAGRQ